MCVRVCVCACIPIRLCVLCRIFYVNNWSAHSSGKHSHPCTQPPKQSWKNSVHCSECMIREARVQHVKYSRPKCIAKIAYGSLNIFRVQRSQRSCACVPQNDGKGSKANQQPSQSKKKKEVRMTARGAHISSAHDAACCTLHMSV